MKSLYVSVAVSAEVHMMLPANRLVLGAKDTCVKADMPGNATRKIGAIRISNNFLDRWLSFLYQQGLVPILVCSIKC
jgi:hypothetical protein